MDLDLANDDKKECVRAMAQAYAQVRLPLELQYLPPEEAAALEALVAAGGRVPVATFSRQFGEVRLMGPGRLEREEPWFDPVSAAEALWYRGFLYRAFDQVAEGMVEFYYLPDEWLEQFPRPAGAAPVDPAPVLVAAESPAAHSPAPSTAVDDLTTIIAAAQMEPLPDGCLDRLRPFLLSPEPDRFALLMALGLELDLLRPGPEGSRPARPAAAWLKQGREAQLRSLADAWSRCTWSELHHTPGLVCEGSGWSNDPLVARAGLLDALPRRSDWYDLATLQAHLRETTPDFQRPDGDYDTWYVREEGSPEYLRGFKHWDRVEGRLISYLIRGPMHWLGLTDVTATAYRLNHRGLAWLRNEPATGSDRAVPVIVAADGGLQVPVETDRYVRFQASRIADLQPLTSDQIYHYVLAPRTLARAREQGIDEARILQFLERSGDRPVPPSVRRAIQRWFAHGVEGRLSQVIVLRVKDEAILDTLRNHPDTRGFIGESLGPLAAMVRGEDWAALRRATAQLGLLLDDDTGF